MTMPIKNAGEREATAMAIRTIPTIIIVSSRQAHIFRTGLPPAT